MAVISGILKDPIGSPRVGVVIELRAVRTSATVITQARSQSITDATGKYTLTAEPGVYDVMVTDSGRQPERVGGITVALNSQNGTLNDFLTIPGEADLTPEIVAAVDRMRADAAASAAAAKVSENNSAAAMTNALSKVSTADQSVASTVLFTKPLRVSSAASITGFIPSSQGAWVSWNRKTASDDGLTGATDFINHKGTLNGGWHFWSTDGTTINLSTRINWDGSIKTMGGIISYTDQIMQAGATTPNLLLRFRDKDGIEKGAVYSQTDTGVMNVRWNGTTNTASFRADGFVSLFNGLVLNNAFTTTGSVPDIGALPFIFRGGDRADLVHPNNASIATSNGFSIVSTATTGTASNVVKGAPVFSVNAKLGTASVLNNLYVGTSSVWHASNTTVDANGFLKKASPIVKLFGTGECELNDHSQGVTTERISEGVYRVYGVMGFNSDPAWGGPNGGIGLPRDNNDLTLLWVDYEVDETGDLLIKTFHRINSTAPKFAQNIVTGYKEGAPIDIPAGRWIDLRVEMPASDEPDPVFEPEPTQDPEVVPEPDTDQQPEVGVGQPATPEPEEGNDPDQGDTPEAETKE